MHHSKFYHSFFDGYTEVNVPKKNGSGYRIERIYTGNYYEQAIPKKQRYLLLACFWLCFAAAIGLYVPQVMRNAGSNYIWYVALPGLLCPIPLACLLLMLVRYTFIKNHMTEWEYRQKHLSLRKSARIAAGVMLWLAAAVLVYIGLNNSLAGKADFICFAAYLLAGLLLLLVDRIEKRIPYGSSESPEYVSDGSRIRR